jgi:hypothetical protein
MADWNTSSSRDKNALLKLLDDPKKVTAAVVGLGVLLVGVWALSFLDKKEEPDASAVAFSLPDPAKALSAPESGISLAKARGPSGDAPAPAEADALKALQAEAAQEVSDSPAAEDDAESDVPVEGEDERGAPGRPIAEGAAFFGGGGGSAGGFAGAGSGGFAGAPGSGAEMAAGVGPGTALGDGGPGARSVQGVAGSGRTVSSGGRALRSGSVGGASGAAGKGTVAGGGNKFAPAGATGSVYGAGPGVTGGSTVGGTGAGTGGGGAGLRADGGGGGVEDGAPGGNPGNPTGGGGDPPGGPGGPGEAPVTAKKRSEVNQDAAAVLKTAKSYRTNVVVKIMAEEKLDVQQVGAASKQAGALLKADGAALKKAEDKLGAFPDAAQSLAEARAFLGEHQPRFSEGGAALTKAARAMGKVPAQCTLKAEHATAQDDGSEVDPKGALQAHRDAVSALRRVAVARVAVAQFHPEFRSEWPTHEAAIRATDPKLANAYKKAALDLEKDLAKVVKSLPATLYPTKGKGKAAKKDMGKKLKPVRAANEKGVKDFSDRNAEFLAAYRGYKDTPDRAKARDSAWLAVEGARQVDAADLTTGVSMLTAAETSLPALVIAGENAVEAYMESCDQWAALKSLAKDTPK